MSPNHVRILQQRLEELQQIEPVKKSWDELKTWHARTRPLIAKHYSSELVQFDKHIHPRWPAVFAVGGQRRDSREEQREMAAKNNIVKGVKDNLTAQLMAVIELDSLETTPHHEPSAMPFSNHAATQSNEIFIVHGHDNEMKLDVARTISELGLHPLILHEQPNGGKTIMEKFEANSLAVNFAIVLLSPDDMAYSSKGTAKEAVPRARQNVILELGYFAGALGRDRVFCLKRGSHLDIPSDFSGVVYTAFDSPGHWKYDLVKELKHAGYSVDANRLLSRS